MNGSNKADYAARCIAAAKAGTASNKEMVKALWSTRGEYLLRAGTLSGFAHPIGVTKSDLVNCLRTLPEDKGCGLRLVGANPSWFVESAGTPAPKAKDKAKAKRAPRTPAPIGGTDAGEGEGAGTPGEGEPGGEGTPAE